MNNDLNPDDYQNQQKEGEHCEIINNEDENKEIEKSEEEDQNQEITELINLSRKKDQKIDIESIEREKKSKEADFKRYLEEKQLMHTLTNVLVEFYETSDKPNDPVDYIRQFLSRVDGHSIDSIKNENEELKSKLETLKTKLFELQEELKEYQN